MVFQNQRYDHQALCHTIKWRIALWSKAWKEDIHYSTEELVRNFTAFQGYSHKQGGATAEGRLACSGTDKFLS